MGGQTALNCALDLAAKGSSKQFGVEMIGASQDAIDKAEDRERFDKAMKKIGLATPRSAIAHSMEEALQVQSQLGFPCASFDRLLPSAAAAAALPITLKSSRRSATGGWICRPPMNC